MVPSPCTRRCALDAADQCTGCGRTIAEIIAWPTATIGARREIAGKAAARLAKSDAAGDRNVRD